MTHGIQIRLSENLLYLVTRSPLRGGERLVAAFIDKTDTNASLTIIALI